jgi:UDP-N-acetylmuramate: L-alanyl-gamma-D-glutamyl-meso-diaminopimelate ligase
VNKPHFHFIGICGTAMGSVAAAMKQRGFTITGSDQGIYPPMSTFLEEQGIGLSAGFKAENIPASTDTVVVGNAISRGNPELESVLDRKLLYTSLPEVLKHHFLHGKRNLVVTGTHGKTTSSSLLTWILESAGKNPSHMIGGIPKNLGQGARFTDSEFTVLEGDEYDTAFFDKRSKFHHYLPEVVVINNIEFDHADIFDNLDEIKLSFKRLLNIVPGNGHVFINADDPDCIDVAQHCPAPVSTVGFAEDADRRIEIVAYRPGESEFKLDGETYTLAMDGEYNVRNAAMAICTASFTGLSAEQIRTAIASFEGIARRQDIRGEANGIKVIDDFGHHPTAIKGAIAGFHQRFPGARLWALFEPRSNTTKRKVSQHTLPAAFSDADGVFISAIDQPEKVPAHDRLDPQKVIADIRAGGVAEAHYEPDAAAIVAKLTPLAKPGDIIIVFSNGGFDGIHDKLLAALK